MFQLATGLANDFAKAMDDSMWDLEQWSSLTETMPLACPWEQVHQIIVLLGLSKTVNFYRRILMPSNSSPSQSLS